MIPMLIAFVGCTLLAAFFRGLAAAMSDNSMPDKWTLGDYGTVLSAGVVGALVVGGVWQIGLTIWSAL